MLVWGDGELKKTLTFLLIVASASIANAAELAQPMRASLDGAVAALVSDFNAAELERRDRAPVQLVGPEGAPYLARATYRQIKPGYELLKVDGNGSLATVRVRADEFEKRTTNAQAEDPARSIATAAWYPTQRGYFMDFTLRLDGKNWKQVGSEVSHPVLGTIGADELNRVLEYRGRRR